MIDIHTTLDFLRFLGHFLSATAADGITWLPGWDEMRPSMTSAPSITANLAGAPDAGQRLLRLTSATLISGRDRSNPSRRPPVPGSSF